MTSHVDHCEVFARSVDRHIARTCNPFRTEKRDMLFEIRRPTRGYEYWVKIFCNACHERGEENDCIFSDLHVAFDEMYRIVHYTGVAPPCKRCASRVEG